MRRSALQPNPLRLFRQAHLRELDKRQRTRDEFSADRGTFTRPHSPRSRSRNPQIWQLFLGARPVSVDNCIRNEFRPSPIPTHRPHSKTASRTTLQGAPDVCERKAWLGTICPYGSLADPPAPYVQRPGCGLHLSKSHLARISK